MESILLLGTSISQLPAINDSLQSGLRVGAAGNYESHLDLIENEKFTFHQIKLNDFDKIYSLARKYDAVTTIASDFTLSLLYKLHLEGINTIGLPEPASLIPVLTNKKKFRERMSSAGLYTPPFEIIDGTKSNFASHINLKFPLIVKPLDSSGSKGVSKCSDIQTLDLSVAKALAFSNSELIIVEQCIVKTNNQVCGDGVIINGKVKFFGHGRGITYDNSFIPLAEQFPYPNKMIIDETIRQLEYIAKKLKIKFMLFNVDAIPYEKGVFICELTPRLGGNYLYKAIEECYGINLFKYALHMSQNDQNEYDYTRYQAKKFVLTGMIHKSEQSKKLTENQKDIFKNLQTSSLIPLEKDTAFENYELKSKTYGNMIFSSTDPLFFDFLMTFCPDNFEIDNAIF